MADVDIHVSRRMQASAPRIWAVLEDLNRVPEWLAFAGAVEDVSAPTVAPGVRYSVRPTGRMEPTTSWVIAEVEPRGGWCRRARCRC